MIVDQAGTLRQNDRVSSSIFRLSWMTFVAGQNFSVQICKTKCLFSDIFFQHSRTVLQIPATVYYNKAILSNLFLFRNICTIKKKNRKKCMPVHGNLKHLRNTAVRQTMFTHRSVFIILLCAKISTPSYKPARYTRLRSIKYITNGAASKCHHR